jgi:hypothetical protein
LKLRIVGGVMPAGICFKTVCDIAETCASAALMFTVGWKKILMNRQRSQPAGLYVLDPCGYRGELDLHLPAEQVGKRGAAKGHVEHVDAGHHFEQLTGNI